MLPDLPPFRLSKLGPIKNEILAYFIVTGTILLYIGKKTDVPFRYFLMSGGMMLFFTGPGFWLYATLKLQSTPQEVAFLRNTKEIVEDDKAVRREKEDQEGPNQNRH